MLTLEKITKKPIISLDPSKKLLIRSNLKDSQKKAISLIIKRHKVAIFAKPGHGKTALTLYALSALTPKRTLIIAPPRVCETVWAQEALNWEELQHLTFTLLRGTPKKRSQKLNRETDFHLINYELLPWLKDNIDIAKTYDAIVFDELSMMKSPGSQRFKAVKKAISKIPICIGLTGTPTGNSLLGVWSQIYCVAGDKNPLGKSHYYFKERYFRRGGFENREYLPWPDTHDRILSDIKDYAFSVPQTASTVEFSPVKVSLPEALKPAYKELSDAFMLEVENGNVLAPTGGALTNKLRQFESGVIYTDNDPQHLHDEKLEATKILVEGLNGDPLIIFYEYRSELSSLLKVYPKANEISVSDWNTGNHPVILLHPKSAGHGLNLQKGGCNILFYTAPWSLELWLQSIGRVDRTGQTRQVTVYHFEGFPVENRVIRALKNHEKIERKTFEGLEL
jgi:hypothetical protein